MHKSALKGTVLPTALLLALSACGGSDDSDSANADNEAQAAEPTVEGETTSDEFTFDFTSSEPAGPAEEITITVDDSVADEHYDSHNVLDAVTVRTAGECTVEVEYHWSDRFDEEVTSLAWEHQLSNSTGVDSQSNEVYAFSEEAKRAHVVDRGSMYQIDIDEFVQAALDAGSEYPAEEIRDFWASAEEDTPENPFADESYSTALIDTECPTEDQDTRTVAQIPFSQIEWSEGYWDESVDDCMEEPCHSTEYYTAATAEVEQFRTAVVTIDDEGLLRVTD
ncbi:hypothetical protein [Nesterenkonia sp. NBAIMH1]|uniref:hypothetical protein n=1 Tax=Nesterenkonia sp. NBAIMH1 TaxID=2600320 RepID=UPI0011B639C2|nr:hypothetical protein [Nesterenkonia sp. NBAIMH1]